MLKHSRKGTKALARAAAVAGIFVALPAGSALAATDTSGVTVTGASNTLTAPTFGDFAGATLDGTRQSLSTSVASWNVSDNRGTGAGWSVTVSASQPQTADATPVVMPSSATLTLTAPDVSATDTQNGSTAPTVVGGNLLGGTISLATAGADAGMGSWDFAQAATDLAIVVPSETKAGAYTSTVTTTLGAAL